MYQNYKDKTPNMCFFSLHICLSLSYALYTSECVCVFKWGTHLLYLYSIFHLIFSLIGRPQQTYWDYFTLEDTKHIIFILEGSIDPTYNKGFTSWIYDNQIK